MGGWLPQANAQANNMKPSQTNIPGRLVTVPVKLVNDRPYVEAEVNGQKLLFLLDTGASSHFIQDKIARDLRLSRVGQTSSQMGFGGTFNASTIASVSLLRIGGAEFRNFEIIMDPRPAGAVYGGDDVAGILGYPLFSGCTLRVDYPASEVVLSSDSLNNTRDKGTHTLRGSDTPTVRIRIGKSYYDILVDTGASAGLLVPDRLVQFVAPKEDLSRAPDTKSQGIGTGLQDMWNIQIPYDFILDPFTLAKPTAAAFKPSGMVIYTDMKNQLIMGGKVLKYYVATFDQRRNLLKLQGPERLMIEKGQIVPDPSASSTISQSASSSSSPTATRTPGPYRKVAPANAPRPVRYPGRE